jgi:ribonucleoside-diphosphate reductase alpha chain
MSMAQRRVTVRNRSTCIPPGVDKDQISVRTDADSGCCPHDIVSMIELRRPSPFIDLAAVEAWDAWFRWREPADLHDLSIEDTWRRVSAALASVEPGGETATWQTRFMDALASWRLLPDERLLASAGTGRATYGDGVLHASLNAAGFVSLTPATGASIDLAALRDCAALAVRALDNAALQAGITAPHLRIGMIGIADALALLGLRYDSSTGRMQAAAMARALAEGCLHGSILLARARGPCGHEAHLSIARARLRGLPEELLDDAGLHGVRHAQLTAITSQPRLALLANDVADAVDPLREKNHTHAIAASHGQRTTVRSSEFALNILHAGGIEPEGLPDTLPGLSWKAQIAMRAALQPWMDEPIDYPLLVTNDLDDAQRHEARKLAADHGLGEPTWREVAELQPL